MSIPFAPIPKPFGYRLTELSQSLLIIRDCLEEIQAGNSHMIVPIYGQLRALLWDKTKNDEKNLLAFLAEKSGVSPELYWRPPPDRSEGPQPDMSMDGFPVTRKPVDPRQEKILFDDFLDINVMSVRGRTYSPRDIIERLANKAGGAHWDPKHYAEMMLPGPASSMFNQVQLHIARVAFSLGREILKSLVDIELHATVYARPEEGSEKGTFIDFKMPNSPTRLRFGYDREYKPKLLITGYDGKSLTVRVEPLIDWQLPHHWGLIHTITDDLKSHLAIEVDGIIEGEVEAQLPVLTSSDSLQYDMYLNRSHSNEVSDTVTALAMIDLFKRDLSSTERAKKLLHFEEFRLNVDEYYSVIPKGEHGHAPYGSNDITFTERTRRKLKDLLDD